MARSASSTIGIPEVSPPAPDSGALLHAVIECTIGALVYALVAGVAFFAAAELPKVSEGIIALLIFVAPFAILIPLASLLRSRTFLVGPLFVVAVLAALYFIDRPFRHAERGASTPPPPAVSFSVSSHAPR